MSKKSTKKIQNEIEDEVVSTSEIIKDDSKIEKKTIYRYGSETFLKPEDKIRRHLESALTVSGLDTDSVTHITNFLCNSNLIFQIVNPNPVTIFISKEKIYASEEDAKNGTNPLN